MKKTWHMDTSGIRLISPTHQIPLHALCPASWKQSAFAFTRAALPREEDVAERIHISDDRYEPGVGSPDQTLELALRSAPPPSTRTGRISVEVRVKGLPHRRTQK